MTRRVRWDHVTPYQHRLDRLARSGRSAPHAPDRSWLLSSLLVLWSGLCLFHLWRYHAYLIDDSFISFRYAQYLLDGHGLIFNPGERVEGYTNFLLVLFAAGYRSVDA